MEKASITTYGYIPCLLHTELLHLIKYSKLWQMSMLVLQPQRNLRSKPEILSVWWFPVLWRRSFASRG